MPEQNKKIISKYQGDKNPDERYLKLGRKITDAMGHKISGVTSDDPEYWGLREVLTPEMCDIANKMKLRQHYTFEQLLEMNRDYEAIDLQKILDEMSYIGILEYDYGDNYDHTHELKDRPRIRRYRLPFYVPGSAELFNSSVDRIAKNPAVASFFERMTFIPLAGITQMVPPGGDGIGMHVIPVEKAIDAESKSIDLSISHTGSRNTRVTSPQVSAPAALRAQCSATAAPTILTIGASSSATWQITPLRPDARTT